MSSRQKPWPHRWLMTDERAGERLWVGLDRLPKDSGVVFRHHSTEPDARHRLAERIADLCQRRGLVLAYSGEEDVAARLGAALVHNPAITPRRLPFSLSVHSIAEALRARERQAALVFVSPVHGTRSHPGAKPLGPALAKRIAAAAAIPAIALGGMDEKKFAALGESFHGWAAIDAWIDWTDEPSP